jgi:hypothetical protein
VIAAGIGLSEPRIILADEFVDSMTNASESGGLAGTSPDGESGSTQKWTSYWFDNYGSPGAQYYDTLTSPSATYPSGEDGGVPLTPQRGPTGTTFTVAGWNATDNGAFIAVNPGNSGLITAKATISFASTVGDWACIGLDPDMSYDSAPPDVYNNQGGIEMIVRPAISGDYAQFFIDTYPAFPSAYEPFGTEAGDLVAIPAADGDVWGLVHTISLTLNPSTGVVSSYVDGALVASGTLTSTDLASFRNPTDMGLFIGIRGSFQAPVTTPTSPTSLTFSNVSVVPEPASIGLILNACVGLLIRRRRPRPMI